MSSFRLAFSLRPTRTFLWGSACAALSGVCALSVREKIYLDVNVANDAVLDPATSIAFPKSITIPSKIKIPTVELVGLGVRTVSFLGIKVYSVGFYADLNNPNLKIPKSMPAADKVSHIIQNTTCVLRIVPTRTTSYTHLRDAFMRALNARLALAQQNHTLTEEDALAVASPLRKLKTLFPNSPFNKHEPLDIYLAAPQPGHPRLLVFRDLGSVESNWVAPEIVLHYFGDHEPSPPLKKSVFEHLEAFEKL